MKNKLKKLKKKLEWAKGLQKKYEQKVHKIQNRIKFKEPEFKVNDWNNP